MLGCSKEAHQPMEVEEALRILIMAIGPWSEDRRDQANDCATRFLAAYTVSDPFLAQGGVARDIANRTPFRDRPMALQSLDFSGYSDAEKGLLTTLIAQLYGLFEVHYHHIAGMPDVGVCAGREWYTRPPSEW
jgi:hypothetical protein